MRRGDTSSAYGGEGAGEWKKYIAFNQILIDTKLKSLHNIKYRNGENTGSQCEEIVAGLGPFGAEISVVLKCGGIVRVYL